MTKQVSCQHCGDLIERVNPSLNEKFTCSDCRSRIARERARKHKAKKKFDEKTIFFEEAERKVAAWEKRVNKKRLDIE